MPNVKRVYTFGNKQAEGNGKMRELLGGKGANLAEMNLVGIPVPPGFTITTEVCTEYYQHGKDEIIKMIKPEVEAAMKGVEKNMGMEFGSSSNPLLLSVRSGARRVDAGYDGHDPEPRTERRGRRRIGQENRQRAFRLGLVPPLRADVRGRRAGHEAAEQGGRRSVRGDHRRDKEEKKVKNDTELTTDDLKELVVRFKAAIKKNTGKEFPTNPWEQLWGAICAVFSSWMNERAILYRKLNNIPAEWGTAVNVQAMVFGNMGETSATGVAFTRDAATGEDIFNGEYLVNAQGEDVVAGIRTPQEITIEGSRRWAELQGISESEPGRSSTRRSKR